MRTVRAQAPSNLAIVKYMGKADAKLNLPANASLSMTLNSLRTTTELRELPHMSDGRIFWAGEAPAGAPGKAPALDEGGQTKLARHFDRVRAAMPALAARYGFGLRDGAPAVEIRSSNTFPASSGIASSASGFAALTLASAALVAGELDGFARAFAHEPSLRDELAGLSRQGSGSSCRSFYGPFVAWEGDRVRPVSSKLPSLSHFVLIVSAQAKSVSSSEAHRRVKDSPLWSGRPARANERVRELESALAEGNLARIARLSWREMWEMHSLFHTSAEPFSYFEPETLAALKLLEPFLQHPQPPIVTLDAGPNVHVIVPSSQAAEWRKRLQGAFPGREIIEDASGYGASLV